MSRMPVAIRGISLVDAEPLRDFFRLLTRQDRQRAVSPEEAAAVTLEQERAWISARLEREKAGEMIVLCCAENGRILAEGEVERLPRKVERHAAEIRFGVLEGYGREALRLVESLVERSEQAGIEVLIYFHLATQAIGLDTMRSAGFQEIGRIPRYYKMGEAYVDRVYMVKLLQSHGGRSPVYPGVAS